MTMRHIRLAGAILAGMAGAAYAQDGGGMPMMHDMDGMMMMMAPEGASPATQGYVDAMNRMSMGMMVPFTGNADVDFITGMIAHHQGAVDAAKVVLANGSDPEVKAFAERIIAAQESEIAWMKGWLEAQGQ
jgi:uncharacterized protein (DUF305 family)